MIDKEANNEMPYTKLEDTETETEEKVLSEPEYKEQKETESKPIVIPAKTIEEPTGDKINESVELKNKTGNLCSSPTHEDSDYEDNIVVTVPSASDTRTEKYLSRRHASHPKPPGIEQNSPKSKHQVYTI